MALRIAIGDIHGNLGALDAALPDIATPQAGPPVHRGRPGHERARPSEVVQRVMALEKAGAFVVRQHGHRGRRWRLHRGLPVAGRGPPQQQRGRRVGARPAQR